MYNLITSKAPTFGDSLNGQQGSLWGNTSNGNSSCAFMNGAYHIQVSTNDFFYYCLSPGGNFTNYVFQVQSKIIKGMEAGITFHTISVTGQYAIGVSYNSQNALVLAFGRSSAIKTGLNQLNLISVLLLIRRISLRM